MRVKVSVIIPAFNSEKTIEACVGSVLNQTLKELEVLVINDGSTDGTGERLAAIRDPRLRVVTTKNQGQGAARNQGIALASGLFIGFVDADDTIEPQMYETMLGAIGDGDVCQCNILDIYPDGRETVQLKIKNETVCVTDNNQYLAEYIFQPRHSYECCNKLIRRGFLLEHKILFGDNRQVYSEDLLFNIQMAKVIKKIVFLDIPFYRYYQNGGSHSKTNNLSKVEKLCTLFAQVYEEPYRYEIAKLAVLIIMINLCHLDGGYAPILRRKDVKHCLWLSFLSMKKIKHKVLMFLLRFSPCLVKEPLIKLYYRNLG